MERKLSDTKKNRKADFEKAIKTSYKERFLMAICLSKIQSPIEKLS